jgi:hypothetical protein
VNAADKLPTVYALLRCWRCLRQLTTDDSMNLYIISGQCRDCYDVTLEAIAHREKEMTT